MPIALQDLSLSKAFTYIASQDPNVSMRFYVPVPNWLDADGQPREDHPAIQWNDKKGEWRFTFLNQTDQRKQGVRIDGSGTIILNKVSPEQARALLDHVETLLAAQELNPDGLKEVLAFAADLGCVDQYDGSIKSVPERMHPFMQTRNTAHGILGGWLPHPNKSGAIYVPGQSEIDVLGSDLQRYDDGAYVTFPTIPADELATMDQDELLQRLRDDRISPRAVESSVFEAQNTFPNGTKILEGKPRVSG